MRVFLCEPNIPVQASRFEPLGLCSISGYLKAKGHGCVVYQQFGQSDNEVADVIVDYAPDVLGLTCIDVNAPGALRIARAVRERLPEVLVIFGGEHPTANPELAKESAVDLVALGEGEITMAEVLETLQAGSRDFSGIAGLAFAAEGAIVRTPSRDRIEDLSALPPPDREILGKAQYRYYGLTPSDVGIPSKKLRVAATYLSRGCPYNCAFCTTPKVWGRRWIARPVDDVIAEMSALADSGINFVYFQDENFLTDKNLVREFCNKLIDRDLGLYFSCMSRISHIEDDLVSLLYRAGLRHIGVGIESVLTETLDRLEKTQDLARMQDRIGALKRAGVSVCGLFMIGYPWETAEQIRGYSRLIRQLGVDTIKVQFLVPFAGTDLHETAKAQGAVLSENPLDHSAEIPALRSDHVSPDELMSLRRGLYRNFYLSPQFVLRVLWLTIRKPEMIPDFASRLYWFLRSRLHLLPVWSG